MAEEPGFVVGEAHKHFSAQCFNGAWDLLDKSERSEQENQQMILLALSSLWHWTQRADCSDTNVSVGYWQASRVYAMVGWAETARKYGQLCLEISQREGVAPFYLGYAYEALARAESVAGDSERMVHFLDEARKAAAGVPDEESRKLLLADLETIK